MQKFKWDIKCKKSNETFWVIFKQCTWLLILVSWDLRSESSNWKLIRKLFQAFVNEIDSICIKGWTLYLMLYVKRLRSTCFCNLKSLLIIQVIRFLRKRFFVKVKSSFSLKFCGLLTSTTSNQQVAKNLFFVSKIDLVMHETFFAICKHCVIFAESWRRDLESFIKNN